MARPLLLPALPGLLRTALRRLLLITCALGAAPSAQAHLMVAQNGTLNIVGDAAFLVLSVPAAALNAVAPIDDDGDGKLSATELRSHFAALAAALAQNLVLEDGQGRKPLQGLLLTLSPSDEAPEAPASQVVVMGRFALGSAPSPLRFHIGLYGKSPGEDSYRFKVTRGDRAQLLEFSPAQATHALLPSALSVFGDDLRLGMAHILTGWDHLLFLLVVLASGWHWRQVLLALSCFTLGHAMTLALSLWGWVQLPPEVVEPAIAGTIVLMAAYDWRHARPRGEGARAQAAPWRLALIWACALIHGLGLASSLQSLGFDADHRLLTLVGFNLGVETAQLLVAALGSAALWLLRAAQGPGAADRAGRSASALAMLAGAACLVQRLMVSV